MAEQQLDLTQGSDDWKRWRRLATETIPGKHSALYFLAYHVLGKGPLVPMTPRVHLPLCLFAEGATGIPEIDDARIRLILLFRGGGKTTVVTKAKPILNIIRNPAYATGIANEGNTMAETFLGDMKSEFEANPILRSLFPEVIPPSLRDTTWAQDRFITKREKQNPTNPSVLAAGVDKNITGVHLNEWVCDDLISRKAAENAYRGSFTEIESTNRWIGTLQPLLTYPKRDPMIFIGTRWWEGDSYEHIRERWGHGEPEREFIWRLRIPAYTHEFDGVIYEHPAETISLVLTLQGEVATFRMPARDDAGRPVFPERLNEEELQLLEQEDPVFFAGQYMLEPAAGAASEFSVSDLKWYEWDGNHLRFTDESGDIQFLPPSELGIIISVDPAFSKKQSSARTAIPVTGTDGSRLFLLDDFAEHGMTEDDIAQQVLASYLRWTALGCQVHKIVVETIVAQVAVANAIKRAFQDHGLPEPPMQEIPHHGGQKKAMRIYGLHHYFRRGLFYVSKTARHFLKEYRTFPRAKLRDVLDALAFQKDEWERLFRIASPGTASGRDRLRNEQAAADRIRAQMGSRRYS